MIKFLLLVHVMVLLISFSIIASNTTDDNSNGNPAYYLTHTKLVEKIANAENYLENGQTAKAINILTPLLSLTPKIQDEKLLVAINSSFGLSYLHSRDINNAEYFLNEGLRLAELSCSPELLVQSLHNLALLYFVTKDLDRALTTWQTCLTLSEGLNQPILHAKIIINLARLYLYQKNFSAAQEVISHLLSILPDLAGSTDSVMTLLSLGKIIQALNHHGYPLESREFASPLLIYQSAYDLARAGNDKHLRSLVSGELGKFYYQHQHYDKALDVIREAAFFAQEIQSQELSAEWSFLIGKIENILGRSDLAIISFQGAIATLQTCRFDRQQQIGNNNLLNEPSSSPGYWGDLYYSLTDLLIQEADKSHDDKQRQRLLQEARQTMEKFKASELAEYFRDECLIETLKQQRPIDTVSGDTAILYTIALPDRCELLMTIFATIHRLTVPIGALELQQTIKTFRRQLETRTSHDYIVTARKLYTWLIAPWETELAAHQINTLVFVPDGILATIPLAALYDGTNYLIERYAVAVIPGLTMYDADVTTTFHDNILLCGLSSAVQGFAPLPYTEQELNSLKQLFPMSQILFDRDYQHANLKNTFSDRSFSLIHIATHGEFGEDAQTSFLLTYDEKISLDGMEKLIRPLRRRGNPIELLTLSACQTAAGDDQAALGLAGMAFKSGARAVLASLWYVNDEASSLLMPEFYRMWRTEPRHSKANVLQKCQIQLLKDSRFRHPCYWAPYVLIGNWR